MPLEIAFRPNDEENNYLMINSDDGVNWSGNHISPFQPTGWPTRATGAPLGGKVSLVLSHEGSGGLRATQSSSVDVWSASGHIFDLAYEASVCAFNGAVHGVAGYNAQPPDGQGYKVRTFYSADGLTGWTYSDRGGRTISTPAIAAFNGRVWVVYAKHAPANSNPHFQVIQSADGNSWSDPVQLPDYALASPSLTAHNGRLFLAFRSYDSSNRVLVTDSADGLNWSPSRQVGGDTSQAAPSICSFNGALYCAFLSEDSSNRVLVASSGDGVNWNGAVETGQLAKPGGTSAPISIYVRP